MLTGWTDGKNIVLQSAEEFNIAEDRRIELYLMLQMLSRPKSDTPAQYRSLKK